MREHVGFLQHPSALILDHRSSVGSRLLMVSSSPFCHIFLQTTFIIIYNDVEFFDPSASQSLIAIQRLGPQSLMMTWQSVRSLKCIISGHTSSATSCRISSLAFPVSLLIHTHIRKHTCTVRGQRKRLSSGCWARLRFGYFLPLQQLSPTTFHHPPHNTNATLVSRLNNSVKLLRNTPTDFLSSLKSILPCKF